MSDTLGTAEINDVQTVDRAVTYPARRPRHVVAVRNLEEPRGLTL
ncbi:hypothetical protein [Cryobacterium sp. M15]|nr:hypothetical protein [Cryobacterium sp. M15]